MKRTFFEMAVIIAIGGLLGVGSNLVSKKPLPLFQSYSDPAAALPSFQPVESDTVRQLVQNHMAVLLDARPRKEFGRGHIPGALNLPTADFEESFPAIRDRLSPQDLIVTYCSQKTCRDASDLAAQLHQRGFPSIMVFLGGMTEWLEKGYPVESGRSEEPTR